MRATLRDPALTSHAGRFVWLEVNYDSPKNEAFLASHVNEGYPLLMVLSPEGEALGMWTGGASVAELKGFLDRSTAAPQGDKADAALRRGDALLARNDLAGAETQYREALSLGGKGWPGHDYAIGQLMGAQQLRDGHSCAATAAAEAPTMARKHPFVGVAGAGLSCALGDEAAIPPALEALAREALALPDASEDDRYQLYDALIMARGRAGDVAGRRALAEKYLDLVEHAPPPRGDDQRMARDLARLRAATALGAPERVIPALEATERALPGDDNSSARLATAYAAAKRYDDAIAACTRGLAREPGPTGAARLLVARASAETQKGDGAAAWKDLTAALEAAKRIPIAAVRDQMTGQLQKRLDKAR